MTYPTHDTEWAESQWGNQWRRLNGTVLIAGKKKQAAFYWASVAHKYLAGRFETMAEAKAAAEAELKRLEDDWLREHSHDC
ncbi:MAG: hypothetical protein RLZZ153_410 [Pseudomonadota bacterium]|jgi:phosphoglucomutase